MGGTDELTAVDAAAIVQLKYRYLRGWTPRTGPCWTGYARTYELVQPWAEHATLTASAWQTDGRTTLPY